MAAVAAVLALAGCSVDHSPDAEFKTRLQGHYGQMIDADAWPAVMSAAQQSCGRLLGGNAPPWAANLLVIETQGHVDEATADNVARAGVDVYCPDAAQFEPAS